MDTRFKNGDIINCIGSPIKIIKWLAEGGQGNVYMVEQCGVMKALKWYKPKAIEKNKEMFYENLKANYLKGSPNKKVFLWPEDITEIKNGIFGYVMPLRPEGYYEIGDFLLTKVRFKSLKTVIDASLNIVSAFRILHNNGFCYQDLNDGNFFINPQDGKVLILDNDNVAPEGTSTGIVGKPGYIAPEIILGQEDKNPSKWKMPDTYSDRFSMSILLFMLFTLTRPLEGKRVYSSPRTEGLMKKVYGTDPHFIMDDIKHPQYGPDKIAQKNVFILWDALPTYIRELFLKAFGQKAIKNPGTRPTELEWIKNLVRFRSEIIGCECGAEVLLENGDSTVCGACNRKINIPFNISLKNCNYKIAAIPDTRLYKCQMGVCNANEALIPIGRVISNASNPDLLGIRNLTNIHWNAETPSGKDRKVAPGEIVPLKKGIKLMIDTEVITIE